MKKILKFFLIIALIILAAYGSGRLYYRLTGGFTIGNITYELPYNSRFETAPPSKEVVAALQQPFHYLGKGCQSYVFASQDGRYVLKFFKYQRFRPKAWLSALTFVPGVEDYLQQKREQKGRKLEGVFTSWKIAYEVLQPETGVLFVHLNKSQQMLQKPFLLYDKMGFERSLNLNDYEFLLQKKAQLLCPTLDAMMASGKREEAKQLIDALVQMILSEYSRGFADNDHALMQNTGVLEGRPVHIDVGQFVRNERVKDPEVFYQELFNKTWKFRLWLEEHHPQLAQHLEGTLRQVMGDATFKALKPRLTKGGVGALSHQDLEPIPLF